MRRRILVPIVVVLALAGCQKLETLTSLASSSGPAAPAVATVEDDRNAKINTVIDPAVPLFLDRTAIGSLVGADGTVTGERTMFKVGEPIHVTMRFKQSPEGLQSGIRVVDLHGQQVYVESKQMKGSKVVTFQLPSLKPGAYKVSGYWGGNIACEYAVRIARRK